jgi:hypothetical protein
MAVTCTLHAKRTFLDFCQYTALVFGVCAFSVASTTLNGGEMLQMQVSPAIQRAPAMLTVRVMVQESAENRWLQVVAESPTFYRSSQVQIDGANSTPLKVFEFRGLPTGVYEVTSVLVGPQGPRATVSRVAQVISSPGAR